MVDVFGFVKTIGEEDRVSLVSEDTESEDEAQPQKKKRKSTHEEFSSNFEFTEKGLATSTWQFDLANYAKKRHIYSTLDEKIAKMRKDRKKRKQENTKEQPAANTDENGDTQLSVKQGVLDVDMADWSQESASDLSDDELAADKLKVSTQSQKRSKIEKKKKKSKTGQSVQVEPDDPDNEEPEFFEDAPPLVENLSFQDMNLSRPLLKAVTAMNFVQPTPIQAACISVALLGKDICACAATGTGKTAAFMLPVLERLLYKPRQVATTRVLVLVPTRELGVQVYTVSKQLAQFVLNIEICLSVGGLDIKSQEAALRQSPDIVIATPGRLIDHLHNAPTFNLGNIEILILDEADRMLDEYFEEQMKEIIRQCCLTRQTMLFSATMTDEVKDLAAVSLKNPVRLFINENTDVAFNLRQEFVRIRGNREGDREAMAAALVNRTFHDHTMMFVQTKKQAHRLHVLLGLLAINVGELHGNLSQAQRLDALKTFKEGQTDVLIATDLAARGLDIEGVKTVINFTMPNTVKHYIHRVGRTARAGRSGRSVSLVGETERKMLKEIVKRARNPVKSRVIPPDIVSKYREKIESMEKDVENIQRLEEEEKWMRMSEAQVNRAKKLITNQDEANQPKRDWFQSHRQRMEEKERLRLDAAGKGTGKKGTISRKEKKKEQRKMESSQDRVQYELKKSYEYSVREAKRSRKPQRIRAFKAEDGPTTNSSTPSKKPNKKGQKTKVQPKQKSSFDKELTNTSKQALREFRARTPNTGSKPKNQKGNFKSKKKYKRR